MNLEIKEINNKEVWEAFLLSFKEKTFLNSWNWGEFQKKEGNKIWRLGIYKNIDIDNNNDRLVGVALVIKVTARRGSFLFIPHGPTISKNFYTLEYRSTVLNELLNKLKELAEKEGASFVRIAPIWQRNEENINIFKELGFKEAPIHIHPELTWELDITSPEDELLMNMRKTTRYLIRQAQKNNEIEIIKSSKAEDLEKFNQIYQETVKRHHFTPFSLEYLKNQFSSFSTEGQILIFLGKYKNEIVSSAIIVFWQNMAFYHHGASLSKYRNIPVSYFLQWEAIKEAKKRGCQIYNFWGIINQKSDRDKKHPWYGLTLFKMGFGGYPKEYLKTQDLPLSKKYYLTYIIEKIRKIKRGL